MSYLTRRLAPGEEIVRVGRFHWLQKLVPWLALIFLGVLLVGVVIWAKELLRMGSTKMAVTNRRVLLKKGVLAVHVEELTLGAIEGATVDQSLLGRIFGFGRLMLRGRGDTHVRFPTIEHPGQFRAAIEDARMAAEVRPVDLEPHEPEPPPNETREERRRREREEQKRAEQQRS